MSVFPQISQLSKALQQMQSEKSVAFDYKVIDSQALHIHVFRSESGTGNDAQALRPAIIFFHGGLWDAPMPLQFTPHCLYYAAQGITTFTVETRLTNTHGTGPLEAMQDFRDAIQWLRENAAELGISPQQMVLSGSAGGAFLILQALLEKYPKGQINPFTTLAGVILFSALYDLRENPICDHFDSIAQAKSLSPLFNLRRKMPPMLLFHGANDRISPLQFAEKFEKKMRRRKNRIQLISYAGADHGFFNFNVSEQNYGYTLQEIDAFLRGLAILNAAPSD